ncbi:MAG: hypothetical protein ACXWZM_10665 [Solirubrobacterales bacterium]
MPPTGPTVRVGSTGNRPELIETIPITGRPARRRRVVMSFGPRTRTDSPLPDLLPGDRLLAFAELEVTTDAEDAGHPGRIGNAYSYAPLVEASLLLAADQGAVEAGPKALKLAKRWRESVSHRQHHAVVVFEDGEITVPRRGLPWPGPAHVNLVLGASHRDAKQGDVLLIGQNEKTPTVVQDMAGIRVVRLRPGTQPEQAGVRDASCRVLGIPVAKRETLVFSHRLDGLRKGEQLVVKARLTTDASPLGYAARISSRLFLADSEDQLDPGAGKAARVASWKGHLSKPTGFNCLPGDGARTSRKLGVVRILRDPGVSLFLNLVAVSAAPFGGAGAGDELPVIGADSSIDVTRYPPELEG